MLKSDKHDKSSKFATFLGQFLLLSNFRNMANCEDFRQNILSSMNLLFLKSATVSIPMYK